MKKVSLKGKANEILTACKLYVICIHVSALHSYYMTNALGFSQSEACRSLATECTPRSKEGLIVIYVRVFILYISGTNLFSLVLERYVAVVNPLKYLTFMKHRRVIQMVLTSWGIPFLFSLGYLGLLFEIFLCVILIFFLASMFFVIYSRDRILAKQLRFNHMVARAKTQNKASAVKWVALITCVFLSCYGIKMRCSLLFLTGQSCNDFHYKIPLQVINSGINPIAYAFFKRDIQQECKRLLFKKGVVNKQQNRSDARKTE